MATSSAAVSISTAPTATTSLEATTETTIVVSTAESKSLELETRDDQPTRLATEHTKRSNSEHAVGSSRELLNEGRSEGLSESHSLIADKSRDIKHEEDRSSDRGILDGEPRDWIRVQRQLDGFDPDTAEFERLRMPPASVVDHEMSETYTKRQIVIQNLSMTELSDSRIMNVMSQSREFHVWYVRCRSGSGSRSTSRRSCWKGCVVASMRSIAQAEEAVVYLRGIRTDIDVRAFGSHDNSESILSTWRSRQGSQVMPHGDSPEELLVVNNIDPSSTEEDLRKLFPLADDIVIPRDKERHGSRESRSTGPIKGYAYLSFFDRQKLRDAYEAFGKRSETELCPSTEKLKLMKYRPPQDVPPEFLRLRRRFRILTAMRQLNSCDMEDSRVLDTQRRQLVEHINFWMDRIEEDDAIRVSLGIPTYNLDELHELLDIAKPLVCDMDNSVAHMLKMSNRERSILEELMIKIERTKQCGGSRKSRKFGQSSSSTRKSGFHSGDTSSGRQSDLSVTRKRIEKYIHLTNFGTKSDKYLSDYSEGKDTKGSTKADDMDSTSNRDTSVNRAARSSTSTKHSSSVPLSDKSLQTSNTVQETDKRVLTETREAPSGGQDRNENSGGSVQQTLQAGEVRASKRAAESCSSSSSSSSSNLLAAKRQVTKSNKRHCTEDLQRKLIDSKPSTHVATIPSLQRDSTASGGSSTQLSGNSTESTLRSPTTDTGTSVNPANTGEGQ